jgi:hypothetical protein
MAADQRLAEIKEAVNQRLPRPEPLSAGACREPLFDRLVGYAYGLDADGRMSAIPSPTRPGRDEEQLAETRSGSEPASRRRALSHPIRESRADALR